MITIGIIGKISSGKSTVAKEISEKFQIPIISFGLFLSKYSKENNLPTDRDSLQNLGNYFIQENATSFLQNVISAQPNIKSHIIIEGIRHLSICNEIIKCSQKSVFIFVEASFETRYERYCKRVKESDKHVSIQEFENIDNHEVESEIKQLEDKCSFIIENDANNDLSNLFKYLGNFINGNN